MGVRRIPAFHVDYTTGIILGKPSYEILMFAPLCSRLDGLLCFQKRVIEFLGTCDGLSGECLKIIVHLTIQIHFHGNVKAFFFSFPIRAGYRPNHATVLRSDPYGGISHISVFSRSGFTRTNVSIHSQPISFHLLEYIWRLWREEIRPFSMKSKAHIYHYLR